MKATGTDTQAALLPPDTGELRLVVFDWDGTLMDSPRRIIHCLRRAAREHGLPEREESALRGIIGLGVQAAVRQLHPELDDAGIQAFAASYRQCYLEATDAPDEPLYAGVEALLEDLDRREILLAVATSKSRAGLDRTLAASGLSPRFVATVTSDEQPSKPAPAMLEDLLRRTGVARERALMVGDSIYDLQMARAAGVRAVGITHGAHSDARLAAEEPAALVPDIPALHRRLMEP